MAPKPPAPAVGRPGIVASFRNVFRNKPALGYILGYTAHCWELYGLRAWMVAFLAFAAGGSAASGMDPTSIAGIVSIGGIASSIGCNELVKRVGRATLIATVMTATVTLAVATGFSWRLPFFATIALIALYYAAVMADSGALTAGTVASARPEQRGATLAVHSTLGFGAGLFAPTFFGIILDLGGGATSGWAWAAAFAALSAPSVAAMVVLRRLSAPRPAALHAGSGLAVS
jgi:MFS family permease